jgi:predicted nucleic acid-binding protein
VIYWDTSCVLKLYVSESDSDHWQKAALEQEDEFVSSALLETEMAYALAQKEQRGDIKPGGAQAVLRLFRRDLKDDRLILYPVGHDVLMLAAGIAESCYHARHPIPLRTLGGVHLATARLLKCRAMATADSRMITAAAVLPLPLIQGI